MTTGDDRRRLRLERHYPMGNRLDRMTKAELNATFDRQSRALLPEVLARWRAMADAGDTKAAAWIAAARDALA